MCSLISRNKITASVHNSSLLPIRISQEAAAAAAPAPKKRAAKKKRSRRPRGYDSDEDWP